MKPTTRKPRPDSVLKTLTAKRQAAIVEYALGHTLAETTEWLKAEGIDSNQSSLSTFLSWYRLKERLERSSDVADVVVDALRNRQPQYSEQQLRQFGQQLFSTMAIAENDPTVWLGTQRLALQERQLELSKEEARLSREKFEFDAAKSCLEHLPALRAIASDPNLNSHARIEAVRLKLFGSAAQEASAA